MRFNCTYKFLLAILFSVFISANGMAQESIVLEYGHEWSFYDEFNNLYHWELSYKFEKDGASAYRVIKFPSEPSRSFSYKFDKRGWYKLKVWFIHDFSKDEKNKADLICPSDATVYDIFVKDPPKFDFYLLEGDNPGFCDKLSVLLHAKTKKQDEASDDVVNDEDFYYTWTHNGKVIGDKNTLEVSEEGVYGLQLTHKYTGKESIIKEYVIDRYELPLVDIQGDYVFAPGVEMYIQDYYQLNPTHKYQWFSRINEDYALGNPFKIKDGAIDNKVLIDGYGEFKLQVTDANGCVNSDQVEVALWENISISTAFSPNGDGKNDVLLIHGEIDKVKENTFSIVVYTRDGIKVFESNDINQMAAERDAKGWNGYDMFTGNKCPVDGYVYFFQVEFIDGQKLKKRGSISLLR